MSLFNEVVKIFKKKYGDDIWYFYLDFHIDYQHFQVSKKLFNVHARRVNIYNKSLVELAEEKSVNLLEKYKENAHAFMKEVSLWCALGGNKVARRVRK